MDREPGVLETQGSGLGPRVLDRGPACPLRARKYQRLGTRTLLAGIALAAGEVLGLVRARHRSREFVEWLQALDAQYDQVKIQVVLDAHSAHISQETRRDLASQPNRFAFVFTPVHASWLNLIERFFAKLAQQCLRGMRVASDLETRLQQYLDGVKSSTPSPITRAVIQQLEAWGVEANHAH